MDPSGGVEVGGSGEVDSNVSEDVSWFSGVGWVRM